MEQHSSTTDSPTTALIDTTVAAFDEGQAASPQAGLGLITDWLPTLTSNDLTSGLIEPLTQLRDALQNGAADNNKVQPLFYKLADLTDEVAPRAEETTQSRLKTLATALRNFAGQLSTAV